VTSVNYTDARVNDALQYSGGVFYQSRISQHIQATTRAGYTYYMTEPSRIQPDPRDTGNLYGEVSLSHRASDC